MAKSDDIWEELVAHEVAGSPDDYYHGILLKQLKAAEWAEELIECRRSMRVIITDEETL